VNELYVKIELQRQGGEFCLELFVSLKMIACLRQNGSIIVAIGFVAVKKLIKRDKLQ